MKVLKARLWSFVTIYSHGAKYVVATFPLLCMNLDISGLNTVNNPWVKIKSKVVDMRRGTSWNILKVKIVEPIINFGAGL